MTSVRTDERGVILIALLWVLVALSVIALSFSKEGMVEVSAARNARDLSSAYYVARAGMAATMYRLLQKRQLPGVQGPSLQAGIDSLDLGFVEGTFGGGSYRVEIQDESGKINLNFVTVEQLRGLMTVLDILPPHSDVIADSIMDWKDVDRLYMLNGAEDEYYQSLPQPYRAKNGPMDTVEELLLVRGVTRDVFYGFRERAPDGTVVRRYGLGDFVTVYSASQRINVNHAPLPVLMSIPDMPPQAAATIFERRQIEPFKSLAEVTQQIATSLNANTLPWLSTEPTGIYTLTASASMNHSRVKRVIRSVVSLDPRQGSGYRIIYWNENLAF